MYIYIYIYIYMYIYIYIYIYIAHIWNRIIRSESSRGGLHELHGALPADLRTAEQIAHVLILLLLLLSQSS